MKTADFPAVSKALLDHLKQAFPDTVPTNPATSLDDFRILQGTLKVITLLQWHFDKQNTSVLEK